MRKSISSFGLALLTLAATAAHAGPGNSHVDFSNGAGGWEGMQPSEPIEGWGTWIDGTTGPGRPSLHTHMPDGYWVDWRNSTNPGVIGDYTSTGGFTISLDIKAHSMTYFDEFTGELTEVNRDLIVELRDYDHQANGLPFTSVWFNLGTIGAGIDWQHLSVTVANPNSTALPAGWGGYGGSDANGGPQLPDGVTFADVLKGVDEIAFTTATPGYLYGYVTFDISLDNISVTAVPEPTSAALLGMGLLAVMARRRKSA